MHARVVSVVCGDRLDVGPALRGGALAVDTGILLHPPSLPSLSRPFLGLVDGVRWQPLVLAVILSGGGGGGVGGGRKRRLPNCKHLLVK